MRPLRRRLSYANVMSTIAAFLALATGGAYAANTIGSADVIDNSLLSQDVKDGEIKAADIGTNQVLGSRIVDGTIKSFDVDNNSLSGWDINESTLGKVPSADQASYSATAGYASQAGQASTAGSAPPSGTAGGDLDGSYPNPTLRASEAWHRIGWSGQPAYENGWTAGGDLYTSLPAYYLDRAGVVHLRGILYGYNDDTRIFTIPHPMCQRVGAHPFSEDEVHFTPNWNGASATIRLFQGFDRGTGAWTNETEVYHNSGVITDISLDGITYRTCPLPDDGTRRSVKMPLAPEKRPSVRR